MIVVYGINTHLNPIKAKLSDVIHGCMQSVLPQNSPYCAEVEAGKTYHWCSYGRSKKQPYCDGSHQGTDFQPVAFTAEKTATIFLCGCKKTANRPYCDGSHSRS